MTTGTGRSPAITCRPSRIRKSVLVVSPTHAEAAKITAAIRGQLREAKKLGGEGSRIYPPGGGQDSEAERGQAMTYRPGDVIQFHQNAKGGFTKGDRLVVSDPAAVPLSQAEKFSVYRPETIALAEGDKIRFTGTVKTLDGEHKLKNGANKTVAGFTKAGDIRLDNGWVISNDAGHFRHGFVETSFGSQGKTVQRVILGVAETLAACRRTRSKCMSVPAGPSERMTLYTDDKAAVRQAVQRSSLKLAALDIPTPPDARAAKRETERLRHVKKRRRSYLAWLREAWEHVPQRQEAKLQKERQVSRGR